MKILARFCVVFVLYCFVTAGITSASYSQARPSAKSSDLAIGLLQLVQAPNTVMLQYEWRVAPVNSVALRAGFSTGYFGYTGFTVGGAYRFFVADSRALTGLSVAPAAEIFFLSNSALARSYTSFDIGGDAAYKWIFDAFSVEPAVFVRIGIAGGEGLSAYSGVRAGLEVFLGYAF